MHGFIEVTRLDDGKKVLINTSAIETVFPAEEKNSAFIAIGKSSKRFDFGYHVEETYWEVKELISKAQTLTLDDIEELEE